MSNYADYGAQPGPEVNIRMKVDIYTEGPNEGMTFDQVIHTGNPDGFDHQLWARNLGTEKASITAARPVSAARMIEYPDEAPAKVRDEERRHKTKSRKRSEKSAPLGSQSSLASAATKSHPGPDSGAAGREPDRPRHRSSQRRTHPRSRDDTASGLLTSSETEYQNTSRELDDLPPAYPPYPAPPPVARQPPSPPPRPPRPQTLQTKLPEPTPQIPESYSRGETPPAYLVETPGLDSTAEDIRINTFEDAPPAFSAHQLGSLLGFSSMPQRPPRQMEPSLSEVTQSIDKLVKLVEERITTTTVRRTHDASESPIPPPQATSSHTQTAKLEPALSPALSSGSRKFHHVKFEAEPPRQRAPQVNPNSRETLIDDPAVQEEAPIPRQRPTENHYAEPRSLPITPVREPPPLPLSHYHRPRPVTPEREYHKDPYTPQPWMGSPVERRREGEPVRRRDDGPVPPPRASLNDSSHSSHSILELATPSREEKIARLSASSGPSVDIAPLSMSRPSVLDVPPEKPTTPLSPISATSHSLHSASSSATAKLRRRNPNSVETLIDDVVPSPVKPSQQETEAQTELEEPRLSRTTTTTRTLKIVHNHVYSRSPTRERSRSVSPTPVTLQPSSIPSVSLHQPSSAQNYPTKAQFRPPLGDWTHEADERRQGRPESTSTTTSSQSVGIPLIVDRTAVMNRSRSNPSLNASGDSGATTSTASPYPPPPMAAFGLSDTDRSRDSDPGAPRQGASSSRIFQLYTKRGPGSGASDNSASPLPPPPPPQTSHRPEAPPPPPPAIVQAPMAHLDDSIDDIGVMAGGGRRHSIYTISEADTMEEMEETTTIVEGGGEESRRGGSRLDHRAMMRNALGGVYGTGTMRSRSSIDSERSSISGALRSGAYNIRDGGSSAMGESECLSDYGQGRLTPVGREWEGDGAQVHSDAEESLVAAASPNADASHPLYNIPVEKSSAERSFAELMREEAERPPLLVLSAADSDSLRWKKEQARREFFGTTESNCSVSSYGSAQPTAESVRLAPILQRPPMDSAGMYGQARIGMAQVGERSRNSEARTPMTSRQTPHMDASKKSVRPTAL